MKNVKKGAGKHILLVLLLLIAVVALAACGPNPVETSPARIRIDYSDTSGLLEEVNKANSTQTADPKKDSELDNPIYQIIIDGNLGAQISWGSKDGGDYGTGNGFLDKQCTTYDSLVMLLSEITSGEKSFGYFSCELGEAATATKADVANGALQANYFRYDAAFGSDSLNTKNYVAHKNIACLVSDVAATAAKNTKSNNVFILVSDLAMQNEGVSKEDWEELTEIANSALQISDYEDWRQAFIQKGWFPQAILSSELFAPGEYELTEFGMSQNLAAFVSRNPKYKSWIYVIPSCADRNLRSSQLDNLYQFSSDPGVSAGQYVLVEPATLHSTNGRFFKKLTPGKIFLPARK